MSDTTIQETLEVTNVRKAGAFLLDFFTIFFVTGYIVAQISGETHGFSGKTALIAASVTIIYFVMGKLAGGTVWQRIIRIK